MYIMELSDKALDFIALKEEAELTCPTCELTIKCKECRLYIDPDTDFLYSLTPAELKQEYGCRKYDAERG